MKTYEVESVNYRLKSDEQRKDNSLEKLVTDGYPKIRVAISGDYFTDTININSKFEWVLTYKYRLVFTQIRDYF